VTIRNCHARPNVKGGSMADPRNYAKETHLYSRLADQIQEQVRSGVYRHDEKLPSVRALARSQNVSISTAL